MCVHVHAWVSVYVCVEAHGCRCVVSVRGNSNPKDPAASASQGWAGSADTMFRNLGTKDHALSSHMHSKHATTKPSPQSPQRTFPKKMLLSFILKHFVLVSFEIMLITENCIILNWVCSNYPAGLQLRLCYIFRFLYYQLIWLPKVDNWQVAMLSFYKCKGIFWALIC